MKRKMVMTPEVRESAPAMLLAMLGNPELTELIPLDLPDKEFLNINDGDEKYKHARHLVRASIYMAAVMQDELSHTPEDYVQGEVEESEEAA